MAATSRFKIEQPIRRDRDDSLILIVGLCRPLPARSRRLLERCEVEAVEIPSPQDACRILQTVVPDLIVIDSRHPLLHQSSTVAANLVKTVTFAHDFIHTPLVVLDAAEVSEDVRSCWRRPGAVFLSTRGQTYRELAVVVRRLCGLPDRCCSVNRPNHSLTRKQSQRYIDVTHAQ